MFQTKVVDKTKTRFICSINVEKYGGARQATDDSMAPALRVLDTYGYKHIMRICNSYCFSAATMVPRKRLNVTLTPTLPG